MRNVNIKYYYCNDNEIVLREREHGEKTVGNPSSPCPSCPTQRMDQRVVQFEPELIDVILVTELQNNQSVYQRHFIGLIVVLCIKPDYLCSMDTK